MGVGKSPNLIEPQGHKPQMLRFVYLIFTYVYIMPFLILNSIELRSPIASFDKEETEAGRESPMLRPVTRGKAEYIG